MTAKALMCVLALLLCASCQNRPTSAPTAEEAVRVTNLYREENFPRASRNNVVETEDLGDRWRVTYRVLDAGTGGVSSYEVDKRNARIVHAESLQ